MHANSKLIIALITLFCSCAHAGVVTRYTDGSATARTEADAKVLALVDAAGRAFGVDINVQIESVNAEIVVSDGGEQVETYLQSINRDISQAIKAPTNSPITGYSVNQLSQHSDGRWQADVTIEYAWYEPLGAEDERRSMIIMSTDSDIGSRVNKAVQKGLVSERRFNILERELAELFAAEKSFVQSVDADPAQIARLGRASGADYVVSINISNAYIAEHEPRSIEASKEIYYVSTVDFDYHVKVVEFASREVKFVLSDRFTRQSRSGGGSDSVVSLLNQFGQLIAQQITSAIYPMRLTIQGGVAVVNRGIGVLTTGQTVRVYQMGERLIDPDSGESLDELELFVGLAKVTSVKPKYSLVEMMDGSRLRQNQNYAVRLLTKDDMKAEQNILESIKYDEAQRKKSVFLQ